jgi:hypothetical protein
MDDAFHAVKLSAQRQVLRAYGMEKLSAAPWIWAGPAPAAKATGVMPYVKRLFTSGDISHTQPGFLGGLESTGRFVGEMGREHIFGSPLTAWEQFKNIRAANAAAGKPGNLRAGAEMFKNFYWSKPQSKMDYLFNAMSVGFPALDLYSAYTTEDPEQRKGNIAAALTGLATAPITSRFGLAGAATQGLLGRGARSLFQKNVEPQPVYKPEAHLRASLMGARANALPPLVPSIDASGMETGVS